MTLSKQFSKLQILNESFMEKPLRVKGLAISVGMSRNQAIYTAEELKKFAKKLLGAPVYIEHVRAEYAIGIVRKVDWDGRNLWYEAEIYDDEWAAKIKAGVITRVSVGYNYKTFDLVDGMMPHNMGDAELSLVALSGIPNASIEPISENMGVGAESLAQPFELSEHKAVESMNDVSMRDIIEAAKKKRNAVAIAKSVAAFETALRAKIEAEIAAKNSAAAAATPSETLPATETKKQKEGGEK